MPGSRLAKAVIFVEEKRRGYGSLERDMVKIWSPNLALSILNFARGDVYSMSRLSRDSCRHARCAKCRQGGYPASSSFWLSIIRGLLLRGPFLQYLLHAGAVFFKRDWLQILLFPFGYLVISDDIALFALLAICFVRPVSLS